ncbi:MAG TPA: HDOD domain-containing protein [Deltaproteobacteria bacterium]|nr:HDOD domain-containing protein [Deltaproteobacteria bacterium]MDI9542167.1 HDOD domain-containing protein [Pseudomonadota bacterium]HNR50668.1 HDOD domain-containing protein [Deltaproteobacteria bacterium]
MNTYIARQPIFSRDKKIYAYELLFRDGMKDFFPDIDGSSATSRVLSSAFFSSDIKQITSGKKAFINFNRDLINQRIPLLFPSQVTIVEILEDVEPDGLFIENCRALSSKGYKIALDDFQYRRELDALIPIADIIKMDFQNTDPETLEQYVEMFSRKGYTLLAEKVETVEEFRKACSMGFTYFQGYFFSKPELVRETEIPALKMNLIQIMSEAGNDEFRINEMERLIERDVGISYKLLRYLNSPFFRTRNEIRSIRHAIIMLGEKELKRFLSVIVMSELSQDKPDELIRSSIIRAKLCENLGFLRKGGSDPSELFTLGLFSLIDAILDSPMESVLKKLPLSRSIKAALLDQQSPLAPYLELARSYERGNWTEVMVQGSSLGIDIQRLPEIYFRALGWADALLEA